MKQFPNLFHIVGYDQNRGLGLALNYGLEHCKNELVARMDTDDIAKPNRCEKQVEMFEKKPELAIVGSAVDEFYGKPEHITGRRVVPTKYEEIYEFAKRRSAFNHPSVMYRKSKVLEFKGYGNLRRNQDVDLFGRMLYGGCKAANFEESLLWFRSDENLAKTAEELGKHKVLYRHHKKILEDGLFRLWRLYRCRRSADSDVFDAYWSSELVYINVLRK